MNSTRTGWHCLQWFRLQTSNLLFSISTLHDYMTGFIAPRWYGCLTVDHCSPFFWLRLQSMRLTDCTHLWQNWKQISSDFIRFHGHWRRTTSMMFALSRWVLPICTWSFSRCVFMFLSHVSLSFTVRYVFTLSFFVPYALYLYQLLIACLDNPWRGIRWSWIAKGLISPSVI